MKSIRNLAILPVWIIYVLELSITLFAAILAILVRDNFSIPAHFQAYDYWLISITILSVRALFFYLFGTFKSLVRYTGTKDLMNLFLTNFMGSLFIVLLNFIFYRWLLKYYIVPHSILVTEFFFTTFFITFYRLWVKSVYFESVNPKRGRKNILIFGAGIGGITTKRALDRDRTSKYNVIGFIDNDPKKVNKKIENLTVYAFSDLSKVIEKMQVSFVIIAIKDLTPDKKREVVDICLAENVKVLSVPPVSRWINGALSFKQIKKIKIEDLLGREPILLDENLIRQDLTDKTVLVTGAAGSIGSEIVRQVAGFNVKKLILIDNAETPVFFLDTELKRTFPNCNFKCFVADITDPVMMEKLFAKHQPHIVYHAAAYKHVPLMEMNPRTAVKTNVFGTQSIADLAVKYKIQKFVMVSTDKAVNPTNIMGASKRIAEIYVQSLNKTQQVTKFVTTRFGNVLGSNGSVIPIFRKQIEDGGPITITDPEVTRYFMTIPEACQLVLNAGSMGQGGEIFIFDMGKSVKIVDLAKKMIQLSGLEEGKDIQIIYTGMRPGEKLYEELLANQENTIPTNHEKIMIAKVREYDFEVIKQEIALLLSQLDDDPMEIVKQMKLIVPEFLSKNSVYETLDV